MLSISEFYLQVIDTVHSINNYQTQMSKAFSDQYPYYSEFTESILMQGKQQRCHCTYVMTVITIMSELGSKPFYSQKENICNSLTEQ